MGPPGVQRRQMRQPQTSCDQCRAKKLKCDRGQPCSSCSVRGLSCHGPNLSPAPRRSGDLSSPRPTAVEARLRALEEAVFGSADAGRLTPPKDGRSVASSTPVTVTSELPSEARKLANDAELDYSVESGSANPDTPIPLPFHIYISSPSGSDETHFGKQPGTNVRLPKAPSRPIALPPRPSAVALVDLYLQTSVYMRPLFHRQTLLRLVNDLYDSVSRSRPVALGTVALLLSFCAACSSWKRTSRGSRAFLSDVGLAKSPEDWVGDAWDTLSHIERTSPPTLPHLQARAVLTELSYDLGGYTSTMRLMTSSSIALARDMTLHLVDHPTRGSNDMPSVREIKRRVWWYLSGTDWYMATMGGSFDRTYTVNPRHMSVRMPLDVDDDALDAMDRGIPPPTRGEDSPTTTVSQLILRTEAAQASRSIIDALPLEAGGVDDLPFEEMLRLDKLLEDMATKTRDSRPPRPTPGCSSTPCEIQHLALQLCVIARRARLLRPFLLSDVPDRDPRFLVFRRRCIETAQAAVEIATVTMRRMLDAHDGDDDDHDLDRGCGGGPSIPDTHAITAHCGIVISHLFHACAITCMDPALAAAGLPPQPSVERRRASLAEACRVLEQVARESPWAARLLRRLIGVIRGREVKGVETTTTSDVEPYAPLSTPHESLVGGGLGGATMYHEQRGQGYDDLDAVPAEQLGDGLEGMWQEFMDVTPANDDWVRIFANLDSCGRGMTM